MPRLGVTEMYRIPFISRVVTIVGGLAHMYNKWIMFMTMPNTSPSSTPIARQTMIVLSQA